MKTRFIPFLLLIATPVTAFAQDAKPAGKILSPGFQSGKTYRYQSSTGVRMKLPGGEANAREVHMTQTAKFIVQPRPTGDPGVQITGSTEALKIAINAGTQQMRYDSADEKTHGSALAKHFSSSLEQFVQIELDQRNQVAARRDGGGGGAASAMPGMPEFGPDELQQLIVGLHRGFPKDAVASGSEWTQKGKNDFGNFGELEFEIVYRYVRDEKIDEADCAIIEFKGTMKGDVAVQNDVGGGKGGREKLGFQGNRMTGQVIFDKTAKVVRQSQQTVLMTVDLPGGQAGAPLKVPIEQQIDIKLLSIAPNQR
ncbi:MAG: hypothetical protein HKN23_01720 [Verrucomicrobiales bacterium]|nr:hypothetical protein [Verrucomicrobiales bacterium]